MAKCFTFKENNGLSFDILNNHTERKYDLLNP